MFMNVQHNDIVDCPLLEKRVRRRNKTMFYIHDKRNQHLEKNTNLEAQTLGWILVKLELLILPEGWTTAE